jgi:hypothetical protein
MFCRCLEVKSKFGDFSFSQRYGWGRKSSMMWRSVVQQGTADGSKNRDAITFNSKTFHKTWTRDPWTWRHWDLSKRQKHLTKNTSHPRKCYSSSQTLHQANHFACEYLPPLCKVSFDLITPSQYSRMDWIPQGVHRCTYEAYHYASPLADFIRVFHVLWRTFPQVSKEKVWL